MRLLVTGAAGFMGSDFVRLVLSKGEHEVVVLDVLTYAGNIRKLRLVWEDSASHFMRGDICDSDIIHSAVVGSDAVIHFAAESDVDREFVQTNVEGTRVLLAHARDAEVYRFILILTDEVYRELQWRDPAEESTRYGARLIPQREENAPKFFTEESGSAPRSPFGASKAAADHFSIAYYHTHGLPVIVTRSSNNYGSCQHWEKLIPRVVGHALAGEQVPVFREGKNVRDWLYVRDHSRGVLAALERGMPGVAYNLGGLSEKTNKQVVGAILSHLGLSEDWIELVEDRPGHDRR